MFHFRNTTSTLDSESRTFFSIFFFFPVDLRSLGKFAPKFWRCPAGDRRLLTAQVCIWEWWEMWEIKRGRDIRLYAGKTQQSITTTKKKESCWNTGPLLGGMFHYNCAIRVSMKFCVLLKEFFFNFLNF